MQIGPEYWMWVSADTPGVPTHGMIGNPLGFIERGKPYGFKLAWSQFNGCYNCYTEPAPGIIQIEFTFYDFAAGQPKPVYPWHVSLFRELRNCAADRSKSITQIYQEMHQKREYEEMCRKAAEGDYQRAAVIDAARLRTGLRTPRASIVVPRGGFGFHKEAQA